MELHGASLLLDSNLISRQTESGVGRVELGLQEKEVARGLM